MKLVTKVSQICGIITSVSCGEEYMTQLLFRGLVETLPVVFMVMYLCF